MLIASPEAVFPRYPIRTIFFGCCASICAQSAKSKAPSVRTVTFFFMSSALSPSTCHSSLDTRAFSLDHPIRPVQHRLRNRHADLLRSFEINYQLELCGSL